MSRRWALRMYRAVGIAMLLSLVRQATAEEPVASGEASRVTDATGVEPIEYPITASDRDHWAYRPLVAPPPPTIAEEDWSRTALDRFVIGGLLARDLRPAPEADRATLLRRLHFDLVGLPPTAEELERFLHDTAPNAYERLVDRLLASPDYGQRFAQHWLDLARFAETDGFEHDKSRPEAWRYRQWVIDALNRDLPYDEFVRLQIAGDLIGSPDDRIATTFCLAGPDMPDLNEQDLRRHDKLNEITSTVGEVLLGLQLHCAQCHDHKYDPISQADFYRLRAIFEPAIPPLKRDVAITHFVAGASEVSPRFYHRGELEQPGPEVRPRPPRIAVGAESTEVFDVGNARVAFAAWLTNPANPLVARVMANRIWQHHFGRGLASNPNDFGLIADGPSDPELLDHLACRLRDGGWSLKRLHREIVLSATFRQAGDVQPDDSPTTAWLEHNRQHDPDNTHYSRFPRRRLEGEAIRDALLSVSGELDHRDGGPGVMPPLPAELVDTLLKGQWTTSPDPVDQVRRSVYLFARRNLRYPLFDAFDRPDAGAVCGRRNTSTTPTQALMMLNSEFTFTTATRLRDRLLREARLPPLSDATVASAATPPEPQRLVERLYQITFSRPPSPTESAHATSHLGTTPEALSDRLLTLCIATLNSNEFLYVD